MTLPRLLLLNPNTTRAMTDAMAARITARLDGRATLRAVTATFGHAVIADRVSYAIAAHAALDACRGLAGSVDAVILGCFGDPGLEALREAMPVPVIGLAEATFLSAIGDGLPFSVLTVGPIWKAMLQERLQLLPGSGLCRSVMALDGTGLDFADLSEAKLAVLNSAVDHLAAEGASTIILGGAALAGVARQLDSRARLLDCLEVATELALVSVQDRVEVQQSGHGSRPWTPVG